MHETAGLSFPRTLESIRLRKWKLHYGFPPKPALECFNRGRKRRCLSIAYANFRWIKNNARGGIVAVGMAR